MTKKDEINVKCRECYFEFPIVSDPSDAKVECPKCGMSFRSRAYDCDGCQERVVLIKYLAETNGLRGIGPEYHSGCGGRLWPRRKA